MGWREQIQKFEHEGLTTDVVYIGRYYTVVKATLVHPQKGELVGEGIARRSELDPHDEGKAVFIAKGRALRAVAAKMRTKTGTPLKKHLLMA